jgi:uncharacterized protein (TIGR02300 family)
MPKDEWGVKRVCPSCATRFYDLANDPMTCPSCGATFTKESLTQTKMRGAAERVKPDQKREEIDLPDVEDDIDVLEADDEEEVDVGDELLEAEDDDNVDLDDIADVPGGDDE